MRRGIVSGIMITLLLISLLTLAFYIQEVEAELPIPQLSVVPSETVVSVGQVFDVNVAISNLDIRWELVSVDFKLGYSNSKLKALHATEGPFMKKFIQPGYPEFGIPPGYTFFLYFIEEDYVIAGVVIVSPPIGKWCYIFPEGSGTLVTVTFEALETGIQSLYLFDTHPTDGQNLIPHETLNSYVEIREPMPWDLKIDSKIDVRDLAIAGLAFGSFPSHPRWNSRADINQDGKIDIRDIVLIARHFGETY